MTWSVQKKNLARGGVERYLRYYENLDDMLAVSEVQSSNFTRKI